MKKDMYTGLYGYGTPVTTLFLTAEEETGTEWNDAQLGAVQCSISL